MHRFSMSWRRGHFWKQEIFFELSDTTWFYLIYFLSSEENTLA